MGGRSRTSFCTADPEVIALAAFLAGYAGRTREAYTLDLRQFFTWCGERQLRLFDIHRTHIELYARPCVTGVRRRIRGPLGR